ncbi:SPOR domain-containing protein [Pseudoxanthomonas koreensis]|uniref:SPOR domain-containing protein n=1 Tax=Pseudoxanthomonas koreensis TaxID=266061 RepID=UPI001391EF08|nr:SPOR domain-containing protein [Pseudoxanthomonas koreensis]KAF1694616.1 sporulation protein [Pseudoxanthomonas koreensis]
MAQAGLGALLQATIQEEAVGATGYRVLLPPHPDREQAQATADRIAAAGFQDFLVLRQGAEANAIALGSYRSRDTAERRATALRAAGFPAEVRAQGGSGTSRWWLDGATTDAAAVRSAFPAAQDRDCAPR